MSETIRDFSDLFEPVDRKFKIFSKINSANVSYSLTRAYFGGESPLVRHTEVVEPPMNWSDLELQRAADRVLIAQYGPPGFVINDKFEIVQSRGDVSPFLQMPEGTSSLHLLRMLHSSIATPVRDAAQRAIDHDIPVKVENICIVSGGNVRQFNVEVLPIQIPARPQFSFSHLVFAEVRLYFPSAS